MRIVALPMRYNPNRKVIVVAEHVLPEYAQAIARYLRQSHCRQMDPRTFEVEYDHEERGHNAATSETQEE